MNILWFHFHCWHSYATANRRVTYDHGLTFVSAVVTVQRCCQCPAKREGLLGLDGIFTKPVLEKKK